MPRVFSVLINQLNPSTVGEAAACKLVKHREGFLLLASDREASVDSSIGGIRGMNPKKCGNRSLIDGTIEKSDRVRKGRRYHLPLPFVWEINEH